MVSTKSNIKVVLCVDMYDLKSKPFTIRTSFASSACIFQGFATKEGYCKQNNGKYVELMKKQKPKYFLPILLRICTSYTHYHQTYKNETAPYLMEVRHLLMFCQDVFVWKLSLTKKACEFVPINVLVCLVFIRIITILCN